MTKLSYTVEEAAKATGIGRTALFEAMRDGKLERAKMGRRTVIPAEALRRFLDALPRPARAA